MTPHEGYKKHVSPVGHVWWVGMGPTLKFHIVTFIDWAIDTLHRDLWGIFHLKIGMKKHL